MEILIILIVALYFYNRISRIEHFLKKKYGNDVFEKHESAQVQKAVPAQTTASVSTASQKTVAKPVESEAHHDDPFRKDINLDKVFAWMAHEWPMKLGALFVILGFGWLVGYAFINDWIGPVGRIALGLFSGALFLVWGETRMRVSKHQGVVLLVLGASTILVTVFAARELYDFFTPFTALLIMSLATVFMVISSVKNKLLSLAHLSMIVGGIVPLLTVSSSPSMMSHFTYILILTTGAMAVVMYTGWRSVIATALTIAVLFQLPYILNGGGGVTESLVYAGLFGILFFIGNIAGMVHARKAVQADIYVAAVNGAILLAWIATTAPEAFRGLFSAFIGLLFTVGAYIVYKATQLKTPVAIYGGLALIMLGASTAFEFSGPALTIAYIIEIAAVLAGLVHVSRSHTSVRAVSMLFSLPIVLSMSSVISRTWRTGIFHSDNVVLLLMVAVFTTLAIYMQKLQSQEQDQSVTYNAGSYAAVAAVFGVIVVWLNLHALFSEDLASLIALALYTIVGLTLYLNSAFDNKKGYQYAGKLLLIMVVARLLLVDVWVMEIVGRIITFFLIGALFMSSAFIRKHSKEE